MIAERRPLPVMGPSSNQVSRGWFSCCRRGYLCVMSNNNLRQQAGGNPSQGPEAEMANPTPGPNVGGDFPDAPDESVAAHPQDKPDLDEFARKLGLKTEASDDSSAGASDDGGADISDDDAGGGSILSRVKPVMSKVAGAVSDGFGAASDRLSDLADRDGENSDNGGGGSDPSLADLIGRVDGIRTVMVTTGDERGTLSSRPLTVQRVGDDGDVYFIVNRDADWVTPIVEAANIAFVRRDRDWISVAGRASISDDRALLDELWDPTTDAFFPDGKESGAAVLQVHADRWEYWSAPNQVAQLIEIAKAMVTDGSTDLGDSGAIET